MPKQSCECQQCGQIFVKQRGTKGKYCSRSCYHKSLKGKTPHNYNPITVVCQTCGNNFVIEEYRLGTAKFCSYKCAGQARSTKIHNTCKNCGKIFKSIPSQAKAKFCSHRCQGQYYSGKQSYSWNSIEVPCANCGEIVCHPPNRIRRTKNHFCGAKCYAEWMSDFQSGENSHTWKGGPGYYGPTWAQRRNEARKRDGYECQICGISEKKLVRQLDVHHIIPLRKFGKDYSSANNLSNLICLCRKCHLAAEHGKVAFQPSLI